LKKKLLLIEGVTEKKPQISQHLDTLVVTFSTSGYLKYPADHYFCISPIVILKWIIRTTDHDTSSLWCTF